MRGNNKTTFLSDQNSLRCDGITNVTILKFETYLNYIRQSVTEMPIAMLSWQILVPQNIWWLKIGSWDQLIRYVTNIRWRKIKLQHPEGWCQFRPEYSMHMSSWYSDKVFSLWPSWGISVHCLCPSFRWRYMIQ